MSGLSCELGVRLPASGDAIWVEQKPREECGVLAIWLTEDGERDLQSLGISMREMLYRGLVAQQHRGQQNTGAGVGLDNQNMEFVREAGKAEDALTAEVLHKLPLHGRYGLGHNRYTTSGGPNGAQPVHFRTELGDFVLGHNGNFHNREQLIDHAPYGASELPSDSWVFGSIVADNIDSGWALPGALIQASKVAEGAYSLVAFSNGEIVGMRDPRGMRPLVLGRIGAHGYVLASESPTLEAVGATFEREIASAEMIVINDKEGLASIQYAQPNPKLCALEDIYLSGEGHVGVSDKRTRAGQILAEEAPPPSDVEIVVPVLGSARIAAEAYANALGLPVVQAIEKVGKDRAFMARGDRRLVVAGKLIVHKELIRGKRLVLFEDSVVRGDTLSVLCEGIVEEAESVDVRVSSPHIKGRCSYGVDIATEEELIMNQMTENEFKDRLGVRSLKYLSLQGLKKASGNGICTGCFDLDYPTNPTPVKIRARVA